MKNILKGLLPALMVSMILVASCSKEKAVVPTDKIDSQENEIVANKPNYVVSNNHRLLIVVVDALGNTHIMNCLFSGGPCLKTVVIKAPKLEQKLGGTSTEIADYFSGNEWQEHFSTDVINDTEFVDFMTSGDAITQFHDGDDGLYALMGVDDGSTITADNAIFVIPLGERSE